MLENLLKECYDAESPKDCESESIKSVVLSRIKENTTMKHIRIKPFVIAAAVTATAAASFVTANAATGGAIARAIGLSSAVPEVSKEHIDATGDNAGYTEITYEDGVKAYLPDSYLEEPKAPAEPVAPTNPNVPDTATPAEKYGNVKSNFEGTFGHKYSNGEQYGISNDVKDDSEFKKLGSDKPYKEEVYYYVFEFLDGTRRYFREYPKEFMGVNTMDYGIISYTEGGIGEFYTEVVDGGVICGWRAPGGEIAREQPNESVETPEMPAEIHAELFKDSESSLADLREFLGNDNFLVDERYKTNFERAKWEGDFICAVDEGTIAKSPVDGKVIAAEFYQDGHGNSVTVEFGDGRTFMICHLAEINVNEGDTVKAGQRLGICGTTGGTVKPMLTLILTDKDYNRLR